MENFYKWQPKNFPVVFIDCNTGTFSEKEFSDKVAISLRINYETVR